MHPNLAYSSERDWYIHNSGTHALDTLAWLVASKKSNEVVDLRLADRATPFSDTLGKISPRWENPFAATVACLIITTVLGFIYLGSSVVSIAIIFLCVLQSVAYVQL
jgi:amino acid transporter